MFEFTPNFDSTIAHDHQRAMRAAAHRSHLARSGRRATPRRRRPTGIRFRPDWSPSIRVQYRPTRLRRTWRPASGV